MNCFVHRLFRRVAAMSLLAIGCVLESPAVGQEVEAVDIESDGPVVQINAAPADHVVALKQQFAQTMRPLLQTELDFIRRVCPPAPDQRQKIKIAGEAALERAAEQSAKSSMRGMRVQFRLLGATKSDKADPSPSQTIQDALGKALQDAVSAEDFARYQEENAKRSARQKRAAIMFLVTRLDAALFLTAEQREKIRESLDAKWDDKWQSWTHLTQMGQEYMPKLPGDLLLAHLTDNQKLVWSQQQKIEIELTDLLDGNQAQNQDQGNDKWWGDAP